MTTIRLDMLELIGRGYAIEHCVSFFRRDNERLMFQSYLADAMRMITYNTSGKGAGVIEKRYYDMVQSVRKKGKQKEDTRTQEEIVQRISDKIRRL